MIVGRERESALIEEFLRPRDSGGPAALVVRGDAGLGKTALIDDAVRRSRPGGGVLRAHGYQGAAGLPFAALHQLLRPALGGVDALPGRERSVLRAAFAMESAGTPPGPAAVAGATLALLSGLGESVLLVVDDVQWCDRASLDVIGSAARQATGRRLTVLSGTRGPTPFGGSAGEPRFGSSSGAGVLGSLPSDADVAELWLGPLPSDAAELLLSLQPGAPEGTSARRLLREAGGNPLAIIELARAAGSWTGAVAYRPDEPLPLTERLEKLYAAQLADLPPEARDLLVTMSAADDGERSAVLNAPPPGPAQALAVAVDAGLVTLADDGPAFRYPLIRSAVYRSVSFEERRRAHLSLAGALKDDPDRRARHLAAAADGADEEIAALLEAAADRAERRGAPAEALAAMERAAQLTPGGRARAARLVKAAQFALYLERADKVEELAATVTALTDDPGVLAQVPPLVGWAVSHSGRQDAAMALLLPAAEAAAAAEVGHTPSAALATLGIAGRVALYSGRRTHGEQIRRVLSLITKLHGPDDPITPCGPDDPIVFWVSACTDLPAAREAVRAALARDRAAPRQDFSGHLLLGMMAAFGDFPAAAVEVLGPLLDPEIEAAPLAVNGSFLTMYGFACLDAGRWDKAESVAGHALRIAAETPPPPSPPPSPPPAQALKATLAALRGQSEEARALAHQTLAGTDVQNRLVTVRCERALGLAATAVGGHEAAYNHFRHLFTSTGEPVHDHHSYYALADLAGAAALTGHVEDAGHVLEAATADLSGRPTERFGLLIGMARGLLADSDEDATRHFETALEQPLDGQWPFERARAHLEYGQRLRRGRHTQRARAELSTALDVFERLGARPWAERARIELRAAGVRPDGPAGSRLALLTAQELQIVRLAGQGLTNKEIGERLFLSHRTVSSHLYRIFPKLGISTRAQLHAFVADDGEAVD
ncbi:AAA family ATPase [Nonomuraea sp. NPDC050643]|uniref:helix-turn-helix transcriptional regulator n=1 Tax=Nonomuraea sp. NPDC050643 TaxID=3155660 RepID=UPI0033E819F7